MAMPETKCMAGSCARKANAKAGQRYITHEQSVIQTKISAMGFSDVAQLQTWLEPILDNPYVISYPTNRTMSAALPDVLKSEKYINLMREGKKLSRTWNFSVVALARAIGRIAQVRVVEKTACKKLGNTKN